MNCKELRRSLKALMILFFLPASILAQSSIEYDIVLTGGRVIDPETKLDTIKNVGIINNRIAQISSEPLKGKEMINASGLVVCPGFIDLHVHGRGNKEQEYKLHDGVTTMLELEWGIEFLDKWYESRQSKSLINYGASVCWPFERCKALGKYGKELNELYQVLQTTGAKTKNLHNIKRTNCSLYEPNSCKLAFVSVVVLCELCDPIILVTKDTMVYTKSTKNVIRWL